MDYEFNSKEELYERVLPALKLKVKASKPKAELTLDVVLKYLSTHNYTGTLTRKVNEYTTECIDISMYK